MMETQNYWEDSSAHSMQVKYESPDGRSCKDEIYRMGLGASYCEGNLNFATASEDDEVYTKKKVSRQDPMSHRIIEKRRRDRMNNCLADLSRLIPAEYLKKGRGRVEKTEIIEMAIRHMKHLQGLRQDSKLHTPVSSIHTVHTEDSVDSVSHSSPTTPSAAEHYRLGYQECLSEAMHFLVEVEGYFARDALCVQLIGHLQQHCDKILATSDRLGFPHPVDLPISNGSSCGGISAFAQANNGMPTMCPSNNVTSSGINLLNNNNNNSSNVNNSNNQNNNSSSSSSSSISSISISSSNNHNNNNNNNNNGNSNNQHHQQHTLLHNNSSSSDRCSSSGVSSFDSCESRPQRAFVPPPTVASDDSNHSSHSQGSTGLLMPNSTSTHQDSQQRPPANYKFKNSIKQRFSADQRIKISASPPTSCSGSSSEASPKHNQHHNQQGVPIFALHDNGGFYIPLTVEAALLRPHLGYLAADLGPDTVLHPVTISVNFNHTTPPAWSHQSPTHHIQ